MKHISFKVSYWQFDHTVGIVFKEDCIINPVIVNAGSEAATILEPRYRPSKLRVKCST